MYWNAISAGYSKKTARLTLTWDVLKCHSGIYGEGYKRININMRCIEITIYDPYDLECSWLTLTWDVLK